MTRMSIQNSALPSNIIIQGLTGATGTFNNLNATNGYFSELTTGGLVGATANISGTATINGQLTCNSNIDTLTGQVGALSVSAPNVYALTVSCQSTDLTITAPSNNHIVIGNGNKGLTGATGFFGQITGLTGSF